MDKVKIQNYEKINHEIKSKFEELKENHPNRLKKKLNVSWSNWGFGLEDLEDSLTRLKQAGVNYIELHGNHYGDDLGYNIEETQKLLKKYDIKVSGVCGMFSVENDLSSNSHISRQAAIDYIRREVEFTSKIGGHYLLVVPGAVGRPNKYDDAEFYRSVQTLKLLAPLFKKHHVKAAIEPIRSAEVSFIHTFEDAKRFIRAVGHEGVMHINGDLYHMQSEEAHISQAILDARNQLINLHLADSNRRALGEGFLDIDTVIMALYLIGFNQDGKFVTPEPLGPGGDPYPAMNSIPNKDELNKLVRQTIDYFRGREAELLK